MYFMTKASAFREISTYRKNNSNNTIRRKAAFRGRFNETVVTRVIIPVENKNAQNRNLSV